MVRIQLGLPVPIDLGDFSLNDFSGEQFEAKQAWDLFPTLCLLDNRADFSGLRVNQNAQIILRHEARAKGCAFYLD